MLQRLFVQNYAIITQLEIAFEEGMVVITGETGAGKSIIMGALSLTLGERADSAMVKDKSVKTIIEAVFKVKPTNKIIQLLKHAEIDVDDEVRGELPHPGSGLNFHMLSCPQTKEGGSPLLVGRNRSP